ncbi:MAG: hypothetical protein K0S06_2250 [Microvirga sp.]|jgi:hypothetical protein|nr:hypothetical protein [Microvirga sp.]
MAQSTQRLVLDLDEIERQLKQTQLQSPLSKSDPLAELARIVGQNDPFRTLLAAERQPANPAARFEDESFFASADPYGSAPHAHAAAPAAVTLADRIGGGYAPSAADYAAPAEAPYDTALHELQPPESRRSRRGLLTVALVLGTAVAAVSGALMMRNRPVATVGGEPPIIKAESDPLKIKPENPGGVEIPNQNAQVYERSGPDKQTRVVNREEQPVDVQQAARSAQAAPNGTQPVPSAPAMVPPSPGPTASAPNNAVASLGEPRRVRTVAVRPDGTIVGPDQAAAPEPPIMPPATARPPQAAASQGSSNGTTPAPAAPAAAPPQPSRTTGPSTTATPSPPPAAVRPPPASAAPPSAPPAVAPSAATPSAPNRSAAVAPASAPRGADAAETTSAAGGFAVQLSVTTTEETARAQAQALQRKYAGVLGGRSALVRTAEVDGKTLYRVRVGPMSKDDASDLCTKVKGAGGNCFVAKN